MVTVAKQEEVTRMSGTVGSHILSSMTLVQSSNKMLMD